MSRTRSASWAAAHGHVSQLFAHPGDAAGAMEGADDCGEAAVARYLREQLYPFTGNDNALVEWLRLEMTGRPDHAGDQGATLIAQIQACLDALGYEPRWTEDLGEISAYEGFAVRWVCAARLRLAAAVWVDGGPQWVAYPYGFAPAWTYDHYILQLPDGSFNDPLAYYVGDCRYSATSLAGATGGAFLLPDRRGDGRRATGEGGRTGGTTAATGRWRVRAAEGLHLREVPNLQSPVLATLAHGLVVDDVYATKCLWSFVQADGKNGWVKRVYTRQAKGQIVVEAREGLHLREAPALESPVLMTLMAGQAVKDVYGPLCLWSFVSAYGKNGWVRREYVEAV